MIRTPRSTMWVSRGVAHCRGHVGLLSVLAAGTVLRVATEIAYGPALQFYDSVGYLDRASSALFNNPDEPAGYPLIIRALRVITSHLGLLTSAQHLAGLTTAVLVYVVVIRLTGSRVAACFGCAVVVLDGYAVALEQYVMADTFFTTLLFLGISMLVLGRDPRVSLSGAIAVAGACMLRSVGLFVVPICLCYLLWRYRWSTASALCVLALLLPLAGYAAINDAQTAHFGFTEDTPWLLYGRIGPIGSCSGISMPSSERVLCPHGSQIGQSVNFYLNAPQSPAVQAFGKPSVRAPAQVDRILLGYALRVMSHRPLQYAAQVLGSFGDAFIPGAPSDGPNENGALILPKPGPWLWPYYRPEQRWPAGLMRIWVRVIHTPRPLLALFVVFAFIGVAFPPLGGFPWPERVRPAIVLTTGSGLALLFGAALAHFELRYLLPAVPLLSSGGMLGLVALLARTRFFASDGSRLKASRAGSGLC